MSVIETSGRLFFFKICKGKKRHITLTKYVFFFKDLNIKREQQINIMKSGICVSWLPALALVLGLSPGIWTQFVFDVPNPLFAFDNPGPKFVFADPGPQFVFASSSFYLESLL